MRIKREKNLVELTPESDQETVELEQLWKVIVSCAQFNHKLVPVGEFVPSKDKVARFSIEENKPVTQYK